MFRLCFMPKKSSKIFTEKIQKKFPHSSMNCLHFLQQADSSLIYKQVLGAIPSSHLQYKSMSSSRINKYMHCNVSTTTLNSKRYSQALDSSFCLVATKSWLLFKASSALFCATQKSGLKPPLVWFVQARVILIFLVLDLTKHIYNTQYHMMQIILKCVNTSDSTFC